ncbi:MAG: non-canonical purine NTP pyrophosphatase, partial [Thermoanaerobaculia bacterium]
MCTPIACCGADLTAHIFGHLSRSPASLLLVTGNPSKLAEARRLTAAAGVQLDAIALDLPEIQSLDMEVVLRAKGEQAFGVSGRPVIVEETGLELTAMNGFPGPLVKWMLEAVGA